MLGGRSSSAECFPGIMPRSGKPTRDPMPSFVPPMKAEPVKVPPEAFGRGEPDWARLLPPLADDDDTPWGYEAKIDGHRLQVIKDGDRVTVRTRTDKVPVIDVSHVIAQAKRIKAKQAIIDGEGAALDSQGRTSWAALEHRDPNSVIVFFAFDLLYIDGRSLLKEPLRQRQSVLSQVIDRSGLQLCVALPGELDEIIRSIKAMSFEGIVAKDQQSIYRPDRRDRSWRKLAFQLKQEFVIGGFRADGDRVDSLLVGVYEGSQLKFASQVRSGLGPHNRREIRKLLQPLLSSRCPFVDLPTSERRGKSAWISGGVSAEEMAEMQFVRPKLVADILFRHWTRGGLLRHSEFLRLRTDKPPSAVVRET